MKRYWLHSWIAIGAVLAAATTLGAGEIPEYPPTADDVEIHYVLSDIAGEPGHTDLPMYFSMVSNSPMQGFSAAFTYDRNILTAESFESFVAMDGRPPDFVEIGIWAPSDPDIPRHGCYVGIVIDMYNVARYYPTEGSHSPAFASR